MTWRRRTSASSYASTSWKRGSSRSMRTTVMMSTERWVAQSWMCGFICGFLLICNSGPAQGHTICFFSICFYANEPKSTDEYGIMESEFINNDHWRSLKYILEKNFLSFHWPDINQHWFYQELIMWFRHDDHPPPSWCQATGRWFYFLIQII